VRPEILAEFGVLARIAPRVQFDRLKAALDALIGYIEELFGRAKGNCACVGGDFVAISANQLMQRQRGCLRSDVPKRDVNRTKRIHRKLFDPIDFSDFVPEQLFLERILADNGIADSGRNEIQGKGAARNWAPSVNAFIGREA
jgi:hypothetical protein